MDTTGVLSTIKSLPLTAMVYDRIQKAIISGELAPGMRLSEGELADQLGVSRSPVREALIRLQQENLVTGQPNRSCYVWNPSAKDVNEVFSLRIMLESLVSELVIDRLTDHDFQNLEAIINSEREAVNDNDIFQAVREDVRFHSYLCEQTNHTRLIDWWKKLIGQWEVLMYRNLTDVNAVRMGAVRDHSLFLEAYRRKDLPKVLEMHRSINGGIKLGILQIMGS